MVDKLKKVSVYLFIKLFYLLLFLLMCGTLLCGHVCANGGQEAAVSEKTVNLFKENEISNVLKPHGLPEAETKCAELNDYYFPVLVSTNNALVALAGVNCKTPPDNNINVLTKYIMTKDSTDWKKKILVSINSNGGGWKTELTVQTTIDNKEGTSVGKGFIAVAKDEKIFLLLVNCTKNGAGSTPTEAICKFEIDVGSIDNTGSDETIWKTSKLSPVSNNNLKLSLEGIQLCENSIFGNAFLTHDKEIIFVLKIRFKDSKILTALVRLRNTEKNEFEVLPFKELSENCYPYIFPWNNSIIRITQDCKTNSQTKIERLIDMGNRWEIVQESFSSLSGFLVGKQDFTTLLIGDIELLFFTQKIEEEEVVSGKKENTFLWISDGNRATKVGEIIISSKSTAPISFMYYKEQLFLFAQNCKEDKTKKVCLTRLDEHMTKIKNVLNLWKTNKNNIQIPCTDAAQLARSCSTDGLVDFLSVTTQGDTTQLKSNFLNVDATINQNGEVKDNNSVKFTGAGARAIWPIGKQNKNQPYNFITSGFTLVATVVVDKHDEQEGNSLMGVVLGGGPKRVELWCSSDKKWAVKTEKGAPLRESQNPCEEGKTYTVAFVLEKEGNKVFVYIDWEKMTGLDEEGTIQEKEITHFYFGADTDTPEAKTDVTITNVLLYNRPFNSQEITKLEIMAKERNKQNTQTTPEDKNDKLKKSAEGTTGNDTPPDTPETLTTEKEDKQPSSSPPPTTEDSAARVGVVGVLCFMLFGVFTLLGRYVY